MNRLLMNFRVGLLLFLSVVSAISPEQRNVIHNLYEYGWLGMRLTYQYVDERNTKYDPCNKFQDSVEELEHTNYTSIFSETVYEERKNLLVTLDDRTYFHTPAVIKCIPKFHDTKLFEFYMLITSSSYDGSCDVLAIFEDKQGNTRNQRKFTIQEVKNARTIRRTYTDNLTKMTQWYKNNQRRSDLKEQCEKLKSTKNIPNEYTVLNGKIRVENFKLHLDEKEAVNLPGVLICYIRYVDGGKDYLYFAKEDYHDIWQKVNYVDPNQFRMEQHH